MRICPGHESSDHQIARAGAFDKLALGVHQGGLHAKERPRRRTGLERVGAGQRRDQDAAGLGLPPRVDDGAAAFAHHAVIPLPGFGIDRLAHGAQQLDGLARGLGHMGFARAHQRADGGRRGVEDVDLVLVAHFPEAGRSRIVRHALEHHRGGAVGQRSVDDVAVPGHPADVGRAPVDVAVLIVEHALMGDARRRPDSRRWCAARPWGCPWSPKYKG